MSERRSIIKKSHLVKAFITVLTVILLLGIFTSASANTLPYGEIILDPTSLDPYDYGTAPSGIRVFIFSPNDILIPNSIDKSSCTENRLYIYEENGNTLLEVSNEIVTYYTATQDSLYYVTTENIIYQTDYSCGNQEAIYESQTGVISGIDSYHNLLYFIENNDSIIYLNTVTGESAVALQHSDIHSVFLLSTQEMLLMIDEEFYEYSLEDKELQPLSSLAVSNKIRAAVQNSPRATVPDASVLAQYRSSISTQENDVTFPLPEYPAKLYDNTEFSNYGYNRPISWFHYDGQEGCSSTNCREYGGTNECEGFARYAHDVYMHMDELDCYSLWLSEKHNEGSASFYKEPDDVEQFFKTLNTGAYVRYVTPGDQTPADGTHSIVFLGIEGDGIWAYECNQNYYKWLTEEEIGNHAKSYFGCGIHIQYFTFEDIAYRYKSVLHHVNHTFSAPVYENNSTHTVPCTHCDGYLRQAHDNPKITLRSGAQHSFTSDCCGTVNGAHTEPVKYTYFNELAHTISAACCEGSITRSHNYVNDYCAQCNAHKDNHNIVM